MPQIKGKTLGKLTKLTLTPMQVTEAQGHGTIKKVPGGYQTTFAEVSASVKTTDGVPVAYVYDTVLKKLKGYANRKDTGSYQDWSRVVLKANGISWP